ncbi:TetR/AcrR family transcriptional regulator [Microbispora sp. CA-102843]|uniref:TetR/AcrR family transcriptional regulator n=1 Tax=Microbispora sp. CA-102843 TaxID=3239952 RepID=UPI003D9462EB
MVEGLRTRKKERTRRALSDVAIAMFLEHGFDRVGVAEIAAAAEVSKPTLFRYFSSKEDLVLHRVADHRAEAAAVVRARPAGRTPLDALHDAFLAGLDAREPTTGLCDDPEVMAYHRLVFDTPSLAARLVEYGAAQTESLAQAMSEAADAAPRAPGSTSRPVPHLTSRLVAAQYVAVRQILARDNWAALASGRTVAEVHREAVAAAGTAFELLRHGAQAHGL